jgi:hypothetical protein
MRGPGAGSGLGIHRADSSAASIREAAQGRQKRRAGVSAPCDRVEPSPDNSSHPAMDGDAEGRAQSATAADVPAAQHAIRHCPAVRSRCRARGSLRPGSATPVAARVRSVQNQKFARLACISVSHI